MKIASYNMEMTDIRNPSWWKRRSRLERLLIVVSVLLAIISIVLFVEVLSTEIQPKNNTNRNGTIPNEQKLVCDSPGCVKAAATIFERIDESVEPCEDFYRFACGSYLKNQKIPEDKAEVKSFSVVRDVIYEQLKALLDEPYREGEEPKSFRLAKNFYKACYNKTRMENTGLAEANSLLKELGGWPVVEAYQWKEDFNWIKTLYKYRELGLSPSNFIEFTLSPDFKDSTTRIVTIDQPTFGLNREYLIKGMDNNLVKAYYEFMVDVAVEFGANRDEAMTEMKEALELEILLAEKSWSVETRRNVTQIYNIMTIAEMEVKFPFVPWLEFINKMLAPYFTVDSSEKVLVVVPPYLQELEEILSTIPLRVQANHVIWRLAQSLVSYLTSPLRALELKFTAAKYGVQERSPRWKECVSETSQSFDYLTGSMYVRKYFGSEAKKDLLQLVDYLETSFKQILKETTWMDQDTKQKALEKSASILNFIGYADELLIDEELDKFYENLDFAPNEYMKASILAQKHYLDFSYSRLREPVNASKWMDQLNPAQANAFYEPLKNSITFPAGILQDVFYNKDRPKYMNYGAIGTIIGHEITHGFDDVGRQFDKKGNLLDWWAPETKQSFLEKSKCFIDQYSDYTVEGTDLHLNGILTLGENIADNGGLKEAYYAYQNFVSANGNELSLPGLKYTPNQLFWIAFALNWCSVYRPEVPKYSIRTDSHSLSEFRVKGCISNSKEFSTDFNCPSGSKMNPVQKCVVW